MFGIWRRMWDLPGWMRVLLLGQVVSSAGGFAWFYLSLYLVTDRHLTPTAAGIVGACYGAGLIAGSFAGGWFGDRFGVWRSLLVSRFGWVVLCLCVPITPAWALGVLVAVAGGVSGASRPLTFALVGSALPPQRRREAMALARTATNLGYTVGPPLGALLAATNFSLIFVADAATTAVLAVIVWRFVPRDASRTAQPEPTATRTRPAGVLATVWRDPRVLAILATVLVVDTVYRQILTPLPLLLHDLGEPTVAYGLLLAGNSVIIVVFEAPLAVALRHRPALSVIAGGFALVGIGYLAIAVVPSLAAAVVAIVVLTVGEMLYKPTATAHVADSAPEGMSARYQSLYAGASVAGMMLAPALGGFAYQHAPRLIWPACVVGGMGAAGVLWWVGRRPEAVGSPHGANPVLPRRQAV